MAQKMCRYTSVIVSEQRLVLVLKYSLTTPMMPILMLMKLPKERGDGAVDQEVSGAADQNNNKDDDVNSEDD